MTITCPGCGGEHDQAALDFARHAGAAEFRCAKCGSLIERLLDVPPSPNSKPETKKRWWRLWK